VIARLMHEAGYSLQGMAKVLEGKQHEDRDLQFGNINAEIARAAEDGEPVISVDGKKKEQLGAYGRDGITWQRAGEPVKALSQASRTGTGSRSARTGSATSPRTAGSCPPAPVMTPARSR